MLNLWTKSNTQENTMISKGLLTFGAKLLTPWTTVVSKGVYTCTVKKWNGPCKQLLDVKLLLFCYIPTYMTIIFKEKCRIGLKQIKTLGDNAQARKTILPVLCIMQNKN